MKQYINATMLFALLAVSSSAFAQDSSVRTMEMDGKKVVVVSKDAPGSQKSFAQWAFYNADQRELSRFRAKGFSESDFKAIANIAYRTGLSTDYVGRQVSEIGRPLSFVAADFGVPTNTLDDDIPGFGATSYGIDMGSAMNGSSSSMMMGGNGSTSSNSSAPNTTTNSSNPAMASGTIVDVASGDPQFSTLVAAIKAAGLAETLSGTGPFTVFAPTNEAFAKLPAGTLEDLLKPENKEKLVSILTYHVIPGKIKSTDVAAMSNPSMPTTVNGKQLNVKTTAPIMVNNANVTRPDIDASNGVIHAIDTVLMPEQ